MQSELIVIFLFWFGCLTICIYICLQVTTPLLFRAIPALLHLGSLMGWFPPESTLLEVGPLLPSFPSRTKQPWLNVSFVYHRVSQIHLIRSLVFKSQTSVTNPSNYTSEHIILRTYSYCHPSKALIKTSCHSEVGMSILTKVEEAEW